MSVIVVALRKESVDRNIYGCGSVPCGVAVALRKESVDRNSCHGYPPLKMFIVALRKESVDRNKKVVEKSCEFERRSPQGERG